MKVFFVRTHAGLTDKQHIFCALFGIYVGGVMLTLLVLGAIQSAASLTMVLGIAGSALYFYATMAWLDHQHDKAKSSQSTTHDDHVLT